VSINDIDLCSHEFLKRSINPITIQQLLNTNKNDCIQTLLQGLTSTYSTEYSLWKVTNRTKQITESSPPLRTPQGTWTKKNAEKTQAFAKDLA
jgi:hypothetical protein